MFFVFGSGVCHSLAERFVQFAQRYIFLAKVDDGWYYYLSFGIDGLRLSSLVGRDHLLDAFRGRISYVIHPPVLEPESGTSRC